MIVLASKSPRRRELLERLGLDFTVLTGDIDETMDPDAPLDREIARVSEAKARAVQGSVGPADLIISADTVVCAEGRRLGKPADEADAKRMLRLLSGREHTVVSGLCVLRGERCETATVSTAIHFRALSEREIDAYVASGEPMDKAGAYGIQGLAAIFVDRLDGDYYNVMGLPLCALAEMLKGFGIYVL